MDSAEAPHDLDLPDFDDADENDAIEAPPSMVGQDERRMQVRAYNYWAGLLGNRTFPTVEALNRADIPDFADHAVLLRFDNGIENPAITLLGDKLAHECDAQGPIARLNDIPGRSLLSRITDHYMQIIANQAPIGFEAEFVNQRGSTILYRGILLPFSSDDVAIDHIYGVINWKELADQQTTDELMLEIGHSLESHRRRDAEPIESWADGPAAINPDLGLDDATNDLGLPQPLFGHGDHEIDFAASFIEDAEQMGLADWLAAARELAHAAHSNEDRTRAALYGAIGRAWDFALAAANAPEEFAELIADAGLSRQDRAPMTPVVKLVFGADYDKTRLTEYAAALNHATRLGLSRGTLGQFLEHAPGGLKGVVNAERKLRRAENAAASGRREPESIGSRLRSLPPLPLAEVARDGEEFALLMVRRLPTGEVALLGEVAGDAQLFERAARRLMG
nr:hypothetical protein [Novosphingobium lentum]